MLRSRFLPVALAAAIIGLPHPARASRESTELCNRAADEIYNLDRDRAIETFRQAIAADSTDSRAYRGLASALWLSVTFRRGNMTVDDYLGRVNKPNATGVPPAAPEMAAQFRDALDRAIDIARQQVAANADSADGHYRLGAAIALRASYIATVDNSSMGAFRAAREAFNEHERVLTLNPARKDAGLIVGTYRYVVSVLALPLRWMAYAAGFGGDKERGVRMIEEAAAYPGDNQTDARLALVLIYNREKRFDDALKQLATLREQYPRNRLVWLESGATELRAGHAASAERFLDEGFQRFAADTRPRMFGENALWHYKRGTARAWVGKRREAEQDLREAVSLEGRDWVHGRSRLELGRLALGAGQKAAARTELQSAVSLCERDNDPVFADEARRLLKQASS